MFKKTFNMFIAQPMHCCDDDLIRGQRAAITKIVTAYVKDVHFKDAMFEMDVNAIDQFDVADPDDFEKTHHSERSKRMYRLGRSIQYLGGADFAVFYGDWMHARGCVVEYIACCQYQIPIVSEKTLIDFCKGRGEFDDEFKLLWPDEFNEFHHTSGITDDIINEMTEMIIKSFNFDVPDIKSVFFNEVKKTTTVVFNDDTSVVVKCTDKDEFDPEVGLAMALTKKLVGSRAKFQKLVDEWVANSVPKNEQLKKKAARKAEREATKIEHAKAQAESYME